jgi:hypothetical protein
MEEDIVSELGEAIEPEQEPEHEIFSGQPTSTDSLGLLPKLTLPTSDHTLRPNEFYKTITISSPKAKGSKRKKKKKKKGKR